MQLPWLLRLIGLLLLLAMNAFFVAAEFSLVTMRQSRVEELLARGSRRAGAISRLRRRVEELLSAAQLGETLSALGLGWFSGPTLGVALSRLAPRPATAHAQGLVTGAFTALAFLLITWLDIVLAELVPKYLALRHSDTLALALASPMEAFIGVTSPFLRAIGGSAQWVLHALGTEAALRDGAHSAEEIKLLVNSSLRSGELDPFQAAIVDRVLGLRSAPVRELMTPRPQILALPADATIEAASQFAARHSHRRIPVMAGSLDHLIGLLDIRDLLRAWHRQRLRGNSELYREQTIRSLLRPLRVVPESKTVGQLLEEFQQGHAHLAAVVDEFGTLTGLITLNDLLSQIVGPIQDDQVPVGEAPPRPPAGEPAGAFKVELPGLTGIRDIEAQYRLRFPRDDAYETLAGFLLSRLGCLPRGGEQVELNGYRFTILAMEGHRIAWVRMERGPTEETLEVPAPAS